MKKELFISVLAAGMLTMTGCGSSSDGDSTPAGSQTLSAQFIDSAVSGLGYDCQSSGKTGITDSNGYFDYVAGDTCTFKIGEVLLGSAMPSSTRLTPRDLTTAEPDLTNILRLLQTLDEDENPDNGIVLPSGLTGTIDLGANFDAEINTFLANNSIDNAVVTADEATTHFATSVPQAIDDTMFIGKTYAFSDGFTVDSTIAFKSDHTYAYADGSSGTWLIQNDTLILASSMVSGFVEFIFVSDTLSVATTYYIGGEDNQRIGETVYENVTYTATTTPVEPEPDPTTITLSDTMFIGKTYTFSMNGEEDVVMNFYSDHTVWDSADASTLTWSIVENKLVFGGTTIEFTNSTTAIINAENTTDGQLTYTVTNTPIETDALLSLGASIDTTLQTQTMAMNGLYSWGLEIETSPSFSVVYKLLKAVYTANTVELFDYNETSTSFELYTRYEKHTILQNGIWKEVNVTAAWENNVGSDYTFDSNGDIIFTNEDRNLSLTSYDVAGLKVTDVLSAYIGQTVPSTDHIFSQGAKVYIPKEKTQYKYILNDISDAQDNIVRYDDGNSYVPFTSIADFITHNTRIDEYSVSNLQYIEPSRTIVGFFNTDNTIDLYNDEDYLNSSSGDPKNYTLLDVKGSYEIQTVGSTEILILTLPDSIPEVSAGRKYIYSIYDGALREGKREEDLIMPFYNDIGGHDMYYYLKNR